jgi:hypothetical protein
MLRMSTPTAMPFVTALVLGLIVSIYVSAVNGSQSHAAAMEHRNQQEQQIFKRMHEEAASGNGVSTGTTLRNADGTPIRRKAFSVPLHKVSVSAHERAQFLMQLKAVRQGVEKETELIDLGSGTAPLQEQVLNEKRLATYFGKIELGMCVAKGKPVPCKDAAEAKKRTFNALFDTGSCEFWVPSIGCMNNEKYSQRCSKHSKYEPSETYKKRIKGSGPFLSSEKMSISYLSGKVEGYMAKDIVTVGPLQVTGQVFGAADIIDVPLLDEVVWDGIVGLAYPNPDLDKQGVVPLFDNIMNKSPPILDNNVFSYYIGLSGGAVTFGGVDKQFFAGSKSEDQQFRYASVPDGARSYWTIEIIDIELKYGDKPSKPLGVCKQYTDSNGAVVNANGRCRAIVDTGTYLIYGPKATVLNEMKDVKVDNGCADIEGKSAKSLPAVTFVLYDGQTEGGARLTLHPRDYVLQFHVPVEGASFLEERSNLRARQRSSSTSKTLAMGYGDDEDDDAGQQAQEDDNDDSAQAQDSDSSKDDSEADNNRFAKDSSESEADETPAPTSSIDCNKKENREDTSKCQRDCVIGIGADNDSSWTLGQVFLRSFYTVFDRDQNRIGFVRSNPRVHQKAPVIYGSINDQ